MFLVYDIVLGGRVGWTGDYLRNGWGRSVFSKKSRNTNRPVLFVDNTTGNALTDMVKGALEKANTELLMLYKIATELCQR